MRVTGRQVLLASVLSLGVCASVSMTAQASGGEAFHPQGNWAVSRIASKSGNGKGYCALARRFTDDMILTFARNGAQESSLAVDFQKDTFNKGEAYDVSVDPGNGQQHQFSIKPVSTKALVFKLGNDPEFFDALAQSNLLKISVQGQRYYSFDIPDIADGQASIDTCLSALGGGDVPVSLDSMTPIPSAPMKMTSAPQAPVVSSPVPTMSKTDEATQAIKDENARLRNALAQQRQAYENMTAGQSSDNSVVAELNEKIKLLEAENGKLSQNVSMSSPVPDMNEAARVKEENERLKGALAQAKLQLSDAQKMADAGKGSDAIEAKAAIDMRQRVAALEAENVDLKGKLSAVAVAAIAPASGDAKADPAEIYQAKAKVTTIQAQLDAMKIERDRLAANLDNIQKGQEGERLKLSSDNWNLEEATRRLNEAEREVKRLGTLVQKERSTCTVDKKGLESMLFDPRVAEKQQVARLVELEEKANKATAALDAQKAAYEAKIAQIQAQKNETGETDKIRLAEMEKIKKDRDVLAQRLAAVENEKSALESSLAAIPTASGTEEPVTASVPLAQSTVPMPPQKLDAPEASFSQSIREDIVASTLPAPAVTHAPFMKPQDFQTMLQTAGVTVKGGVQFISNVSNDSFAAYSWETAETFGSAEQKPMASVTDFDAMRDQYITKTKERCTGDFAAMPGIIKNEGGARVESYEIACMGKDAQAAASLLFYNRDGLFTTVAHESSPESMDQAMDARDRLLGQVTTQKMAAR